MSSDEQRALAAHLLLERVELKRDIAHIKAELVKRAEGFAKLGSLLRSSPLVIDLDGQEMSPEHAARAQKFSSKEFDSSEIAALVAELRTKTDRLVVVEQKIREMGYSPE
jgi:hypothetical protein